MDTMHAWALWRLLMVGLIALPFLVAAVVVGFRQSHADGSSSGAGPDDTSASPEISGPSAWGSNVDAPVAARSVDVPAVEQRAA
jgi:hypothetical protein